MEIRVKTVGAFYLPGKITQQKWTRAKASRHEQTWEQNEGQCGWRIASDGSWSARSENYGEVR